MQKGLFLLEVQTPRQKRRFHSLRPRTVGMTANVSKVTKGIAKPIAFFYAKMTTTQRNNSDFFREPLVIYLVIQNFRYILEGRNFSVHMNHKPLIKALH